LILLIICTSVFGQDVGILHDENVEYYRKIQTDYTPMAKKRIGSASIFTILLFPNWNRKGRGILYSRFQSYIRYSSSISS